MFTPKPISRDAIPAALEKAQRYRLLNEPEEAESICLDVLNVDPGNQQAIVTRILAITDRLSTAMSAGVREARALLPGLTDEYRRFYYDGIICERYALVVLAHGAPRAGSAAYQWLRDAMALYEKAEKIRPSGDDDAILRWNTCARLINRTPALAPREVEDYEPSLE